jgi:hypothetical protein
MCSFTMYSGFAGGELVPLIRRRRAESASGGRGRSCRCGGTPCAFPLLCKGGGGYACGAGAATRAGTSRKGVMNLHEAPPNPAGYPVLAIEAKAEPTLKNPEAEAFYTEALRHLVELGVLFLLAGTYAVSAYTGISRATKDLDVFCKAGD